MPLDERAEAIRKELADLYAQADARLKAEQDSLVDVASAARRRARLAELRRSVEQTAQELDAQAKQWLIHRLPEVYAISAEDVAAQTGHPFGWTQVHRTAVQALASDTHGDLLAATKYMRTDVKRLVREVSRAGSRSALLEGRTATQAGRDVAAVLRDQGLSAVRYSNGATVGIGSYSDMVLRTKTAVAYNAGTVNQGREAGTEWFEVFDGPDCGWDGHDDTDLANGSIRHVDELIDISHPNCARAFAARPDVTSGQDAQAASA